MGNLYASPSSASLTVSTDPKLKNIIDSIKDLSPSSIRELFESMFSQMDMNAREATFKTLCNACTEYQLSEMPFDVKPDSVDPEVNSTRVIDRQFSTFSNRPPIQISNYFELAVRNAGRDEMEDQIMQILVQVLHRAERTTQQVSTMINRHTQSSNDRE